MDSRLPAVETLEKRTMLSGSAFLDASRVLKVTGTVDPDFIVLVNDGRTIKVTNFGMTLGTFIAASVTGISVSVGGGSDTVSFWDGHPYDPASAIPATIKGGSGDDALTAGDGGDLVLGEAGNDTLQGWLGDDTLDGGLGADRMLGQSGVDLADYSSRTAAVRINMDSLAKDGEAGEGDMVSAENVFGGAGDDWIEASPVSTLGHTFGGNAGHDTLIGAGAGDFLDGGAGHDYLYGRAGDDSVAGWSGDDQLYGEDGDDLLLGQQDNDTLDGGGGADELSGGAGHDTADYSFRWENLGISLDGIANDGVQAATVYDPLARVFRSIPAEGDNARADVEGVWGGSGNDRITSPASSTAVNIFIGNGGHDYLDGGGGSDWLYGMDGDDIVVCRDGIADLADGGSGHDLHRSDTADSLAGFEGILTGFLMLR